MKKTPLKSKHGFRTPTIEQVREKQEKARIKKGSGLQRVKRVAGQIKASDAKITAQSPKKKRKKKSELKKLKEQLWQLCREIQIKRYGRICYCCGAQDLQGSNCHLGHFIPSSVSSTELRYSLDNLKPSCYHCNINLSGNWLGYEKHLIADGIDIAELKQRNENTKGLMYRADWYQNKILEYTQLLEE